MQTIEDAVVDLTRVAASPGPLTRRAGGLLERLHGIVPFDSAWMAHVDVVRGSYHTAADHDLDQPVCDYLAGPNNADDIDRLLAKCGSSKSKVLSATLWVTDIRNRAPMNEVWTEWVDKKNLPARACVEAKLADPRALVETMVVAAK